MLTLDNETDSARSLAKMIGQRLTTYDLRTIDGDPANVADALAELARQQRRTADAIFRLGDLLEARRIDVR